VNTFTQKQMTSERNAFGPSLLAGKVLASLSNLPNAQFHSPGKEQAAGGDAADVPFAGAWKQPHAEFKQAYFAEQNGYRGHRREHAHTIRGGNP
jgi:hypothetical protein